MKSLRIMLLLTLIFGGYRSFAASEVETQFELANKLYAQNKFSEAAGAYEQIITNGTISSVLFQSWQFSVQSGPAWPGHRGLSAGGTVDSARP